MLGLAAVLAAGWVRAFADQDVRPIIPTEEQQVEPFGPGGEQVVQGVDSEALQQIEPQREATRAEKTASTVGKVLTGVTAAVVGLGATVAMLLFF